MPLNKSIGETKAYTGKWVTADEHIKLQLLQTNCYDQARGSFISAFQGSFKVSGNHIEHKYDTGFIADGEFKGGILYHGGTILYKEKD